jgi:hypothetical protein
VGKFLNKSHVAQTVYLPSGERRDDRAVIDKGLSIQVNDERDIEYLRRLCGADRPFVEVPDDLPTRDYRSSRMSL